MKRKNIYAALVALAALALAAPGDSNGQQRRAGAQARANTPTAVAASDVPLPASDAVMLVDMRRLLDEAVPRALSGDPARLAQVNADIERFKTQTGIDARSFERVAAGARFVTLPSGSFKVDHVVAVADGAFDAGALVRSARDSAQGGHRQETRGGKLIHVFTVNQRVKLFGVLPEMNVREFALVSLDADTVAVGELEAVRATVDAQAGRGRVSAALVALARQTPNAVAGFGANAPKSLAAAAAGLGGEMEKSVASIRQFYGSVVTTGAGFDMLVSARTGTAAEARRLVETMKALKSLGDFAAAQRTGASGEAMQRALAKTTITPQGTDAQVRLDLQQADLGLLLGAF